jgi:cell division transport system permease protein
MSSSVQPRLRVRAVRLRRGQVDDLGLRRALSDPLLPLLVAAMAFLAALALAGAVAAASLGEHWRQGAGAALTVQVPTPMQPAADGQGNRRDAVVRMLRATDGVADARALSDSELSDMLRPWLGTATESLALPLPAVVAVRLAGDVVPPNLAARLTEVAPGTLTESHDIWMQRLSTLAGSLQACAGVALVMVAMVAAAVVATATRAGLATLREAIDVIHGLGASDGYIASRFAAHVTLLTTLGGVFGAVAALPVLVALAVLAAPFSAHGLGADGADVSLAASVPTSIWIGLVALPVGAAAIGWVTAQGTVRSWLRRLP